MLLETDWILYGNLADMRMSPTDCKPILVQIIMVLSDKAFYMYIVFKNLKNEYGNPHYKNSTVDISPHFKGDTSCETMHL